VYGALALVSMGLLTLEVSFTRLFSYSVWYHLAYLTISVALLGFATSGAVVAAAPALFRRNGERRLVGLITAAAVAVIVAFWFVARHPLEITDVVARPTGFALGLLGYYLAVGTPFLLAGFAIGVPFAAYPAAMGRLYAWDLMGAALGCLAAVTLIEPFGVPGLIVGSAGLLLGGAAALARGGRHGRAGAALAVVAGLTVAGAPWLGARVPIEVTRSKGDDARGTRGRSDAVTRWTALNRFDAFGWDNPTRLQFWGWHGVAPDYRGPQPETARLTYDGSNGSAIYAFRGDFRDYAMLERHILRTPYLLTEHPRVLVIGVGGGIDMLNAVKQGAREVTGVELQPETVRLLRERLPGFTGGFYEREGVRLVASEGRHFVRRSDARFDLVQVTAVDTLSAQATGAYVLAESYVYTVEAFTEYLEHLEPHGLLSLVLGEVAFGDDLPPLATRLGLNGRRALERLGAAAPERHIMVVASQRPNDRLQMDAVLVKRAPFTEAEIARVRSFASESHFKVLYAPDGSSGRSSLSEVLGSDEAARRRVLDAAWFRMDEVWDDSPFFYNLGKWRNAAPSAGRLDFFGLGPTAAGSFIGQVVLVLMLVQSVVLGMVLIVVPLVGGARQGLRVRGVLSYLAYFLALGVGFMFIEISFVQSFVLFLGSPTHALSVTIFALLLFSSLGSLLSARVVARPERAVRVLAVLIVLLIALYVVALRRVFDAALHLDFPLRVVIAVAAQMPMGVTLGMFMPLGIACVARVDHRLVPWAWGINGVGSVAGTTLAVIIAMSFGFSRVAMLAALIYAAGAFLLLRAQRRAGQLATSDPPL
jgi:spermidine synthase